MKLCSRWLSAAVLLAMHAAQASAQTGDGGASSPGLAYNPAPNAAFATVPFPSGLAGTANATISVSPTGIVSGGATTSVTGCGIAGTGASSFGPPVVSGSPFSVGSGSIDLSCTRGSAVAQATLTCTETESDGMPAPLFRVWGLTCPQASSSSNAFSAATSMVFGNAMLGMTSLTQNLSVQTPGSNVGNVNITGCVFGGTDAGDFEFGTPPPFPLAIAPGGAVNLPVRFRPTSLGARSASLSCSITNALVSNLLVSLAGTGIPNEQIITATTPPGNLTLPSATAGGSSSLSLRFNNVSATTAGVTCVATGTGFSVSPTGLQNFGAGSSMDFTVTAQSNVPGTLTGSVTCTPSAGSPFVYALTATFGGDVSPAIAYSPAPNPAFATVQMPSGAVGGTATSVISATPTGAPIGGTNTAVSGCAITPVGTASFGAPVVTGSPISTVAGSIAVSCTRAAVEGQGTLVCTETASTGIPAPTLRVWGLTCPQGTAGNTYTATASLNFGLGPLGIPGASQNIAVAANASNVGNINLSGCTFAGTNPGDFAFSPTPSFPIAVASGSTAHLPVRFTPTGAGVRAATLTCNTTNAQATSFTVALVGTAIPSEPTIIAATVPGNLQFPPALAGASSLIGLQFNNVGAVTATVSCAPTGTGFSVTPMGVQPVGAGASIVFTVVAQSNTPGALTGTVTCTPGAGSPFVYQLTAPFGAPAVLQLPTMGDAGRWILLALIAGLGLLAALRRST